MARALVHGWRMTLQRGKREGRFKTVSYLAIFEDHKSGYPHLHILARCPYIDQAWLSERMAEYAHGPNVWITSVRSRRNASQYVAKYVSKGPGRYIGCKRYWRSQDYQQQPTEWDRDSPIHDRAHVYHNRLPEAIAESYRRTGWDVAWSSWWRCTATPFTAGQLGPWFDAYAHLAQGPPRHG